MSVLRVFVVFNGIIINIHIICVSLNLSLFLTHTISRCFFKVSERVLKNTDWLQYFFYSINHKSIA